jgi:hypothetical protein
MANVNHEDTSLLHLAMASKTTKARSCSQRFILLRKEETDAT